MIKHTKIPLLLLAGLVGCSTTTQNKVAHYHAHNNRKVASMNDMLNNPEKLAKRVEKLMDGVFHAYLMGQVFLQNFDQELDKNPNKVLKSSSYSSLLAVRAHVDQFEHEINDLYLNLVMAKALPEYDNIQKENAQIALDTIGKFMDGVKSDKTKLPDNLKPLILGNLRDKQTELFDELKALHDDENFTQNKTEIKDTLHQNMVLLRATRMSYHQDLKNYKVDESVLAEALKEEKKKQNFQKLEKEIKDLSKQMKTFTSELGRGTSADTIYPSASSNGNISGGGYPANTWSLTYDDGPGKTTPQVVKNLLDRKIPATFFMLAKQVEGNPNTSKLIKDGGFDIALHSYTHAQLTKVGPVQLEREIGAAKKVVEDKFGRSVKLFRLPYGAGVSVSKVRAKIAEHKLIHVFWTVDTLDWQDKNPNTVYARTLKQMNASGKNAGIILFHDIHSQSVTASTMLMDYFNTKSNLKVCTVQGVVDQINKNLSSCK